MKALTFDVELMEPLLIANPISGDENSAEGLDFIPGSVIRGALAQTHTGGQRGNIGDLNFADLFFGKARFLNAYLKGREGRSLPTPLSWQSHKTDRNTPMIDLANADLPMGEYKREDKPFVSFNPSFYAFDEESGGEPDDETNIPSAALTELLRYINVHIAQPDRLNATEKGRSAVFRYDALAAGQTFAGVILCEDETNLDQLKALLEKAPSKLGKSRSAGYGAVKFCEVKSVDGWEESPSRPFDKSAMVVVTLLSDVILRNADTGAFATSLCPALGAKPQKSFARTCVTGGFNLAWGLPLPQALAIQKGSVFVFEKTDALVEKLRVAKEHGIGERVVDGFGRIAVNWNVAEKVNKVSFNQPPPKESDAPAHDDDAVKTLTQQMVNRIWRETLDQALRNAIGQARLEKPPRNTQLARVRVLAREAWQQNNRAVLAEVLKKPDQDNKKGMKNHAREQFEKARVSVRGSQKLIFWLEELAKTPDAVWEQIGADQIERPKIGEAIAQDPSALEYAARLIDGVLRKTELSEEKN